VLAELLFARALRTMGRHSISMPLPVWLRMPEGAPMVEGLTVGPDGKVYSPTFHFGPGPFSGENSKLFTFDPQGHLLKQVTITACGQALPDDGVPGFGANGVEFNKAGDTMFVCNTAMDWIVEIPVSGGTSTTGGTPGKPEVFTNSINGCDGIMLDSDDNIWAAANQADEIVVVDPKES
jgi:sugar lactone lactonase YvrE